MSTTVITNHPALSGEVTKPPPALPTTAILLPKPIAQHGLLVQAVAAGKSVLTIAGVQVTNVTVQNTSNGSASSDGTTSPDGFVVKGIVHLFGNKEITAEFDIWHGPPPPGVTIGSAAPSVQRAITEGSVNLSQLIPSLKGTSLGADLSLRNVSIYHQNYLYEPTKSLGYNINADLVIDASLGSLSSILSRVLAVSEPIVHIHADLGPDQSWDSAPNVNALTIEGLFLKHVYAPTPGVQVMSVGVRLILSHSPNKTATRDVEVFGSLNLTLPGVGVLPMELDYTLKDVGGTVQLTATLPSGATWVNPMGAQGFELNPVVFSSSLPLTDPWKGFTLDIAAKLQYQASIVNFTGSFVPGGACFLHAIIQGFDLSSLQRLYEAVHHEPLKAPGVDVTIGSIDLTIASGKGFSARLTDVSIAGHGSENADLSFSPTGSVIRAELGSVKFGDVTVNSAYIQLDLQPASSSKSSDAIIYGSVAFEALKTDVVVHLYRSPPSVVPKRTEWTVYAQLAASDNKLALSKIEPRLKGTDFDLALKNVVFIAASQDDPDVGTFVTSAYKPKKGVQVFATFGEIPVFNSLTKSNVTGMVLNASWSRTAGFSLNIILPVARNLILGDGITTAPITLSLNMTPSAIDKAMLIPSLQVSAGLYIPVAHSPNPLLFQMILTATSTDAMISAELKGDWVDPFGISDEVVIGPDLLLQTDFDYVTGLSGVAFRGGLAIGNTIASVAVSVNEDPLKEMLYAEVDNLNFTDVVSFAEKLLRLKLPPPPSDFLEFEAVKLYICPAGLTIQGVVYPPGFSFESDMILFGKNIKVSCDASDTLLSINGSVDNFDLGPLKVNGMDGAKQAALQVQVGMDIQHLLLDGAVTLYAETCALHLLVDTQPSPDISFKIEFKLTELLTFKADATLIGALNLKDLRKADFSFDAVLEQHLLDYIRDELLNLFTKAKLAAENGIDAAKRQVADEKVELDNKIARAQVQLKLAQDRWEAYQKSITETSMKTIGDYNAKIQHLQDAITNAKKAYDTAIQTAQTNLTNAQHDRQVKMQAAENDLANAQRKAASDIENAKRQVEVAQADMNRSFNSAEQNVESAQRRVQDLQRQIDDVNREINGLRHAGWWQRRKIPELEIKKGGLELSLKTAQGVLDGVVAILRSADYVAKKTALNVAQKTLDLAEQAGPKLISDSQKALTSVDQLTKAAVDRATEALQAVRNGSEKIAFDGAQAALAAYKRTNDVLFEAANRAITTLVTSAEYVAFQTATTVLAAAKSSTQGLDAAEKVLSEAEEGSVDVLNIGKTIVSAGAEALNITSAHLSGSLGKSVGGAGFTANVKGVVLNKPFAVSAELNPSKVENFLKELFQELQQDIKRDLHL